MACGENPYHDTNGKVGRKKKLFVSVAKTVNIKPETTYCVIKWISKRKPSVSEIRESPFLKLNLNYLPPDVADAETTYLEKVLQRKETCPTYTELLDDAITVRTIHSAKGLEFPVVVVDLIGFTPWENTPEEIEDECRVLYVAMSRAKDQLYLLGRNKQMFPNLEAVITFLKAQIL